MGLFDIFKKNASVEQPKKYVCARCKKEITDEETKWIGNHRFCNKCAAPTNVKHLVTAIPKQPEVIEVNAVTIQPSKAVAINKQHQQVEATINNSVQIQCLFDIQSAEVEFKNNVEYVLGRESEYVKEGRKKYLLYAYQHSEDKTYCVFAEISDEVIDIDVSKLENSIINNSISDSFEVDEFFQIDKNEFLGKLYNLKKKIPIDGQIGAYIWSAMMRIFPEYNTKTTLRKPIFEKYFPYPLDNLIGAENYMNKGILYRALPSLKKKYMGWSEFQAWKVCDWNQPNQTVDLLYSSLTSQSDFTEEELFSEFLRLNDSDVRDALDSIPHRIINIDNQKAELWFVLHFSGDYRQLHIYQSKSEKSIIVLKIYSVSNAPAHGGGHMEGYTFNKVKEIPSEQYAWSDEELIAEHIQDFKK